MQHTKTMIHLFL